MRNEALKLKDGDRIAVIGGGPAGSFFSCFAMAEAKKRKAQVSITLFDSKEFQFCGPRGCNMCAGVVSETLIEKLKELGIVIPEEKIQRRIEGYYLVTAHHTIQLDHPGRESRIITVFRGGGPRHAHLEGKVSFDDYLIECVKERGVEVVHAKVDNIDLPAGKEDRVKVHYTQLNANETESHKLPPHPTPARQIAGGLSHTPKAERGQLEAELAVGAFGVNTALLQKAERLNFGFIPPATIKAYQAEVYLGNEYIEQHFGNNIYTYLLGMPGIRFVALTPKREHLTVSVVGTRDTTRKDFMDFLKHPAVREKFPPGWSVSEEHCCCYPRMVVTDARHPYTDRLVLIGDASFSRYYKNGIESALVTAGLAAECAFNRGISENDFKKYYYAPARRMIVRDNLYGHILLRLHDFIIRKEIFIDAHLRLAGNSKYATDKPSRLLREILWNFFTGNVGYREIFRKSLSPGLQLRLAWETAKSAVNKVDCHVRQRRPRNDRHLGPLKEGNTVAIIGGGPAGASCAITLKNMAEEKGINLNVVLYEGKNFEGEKHYNQCAGVLSPPIREIFKEKLRIPFPDFLVQRKITGYRLYSDRNNISLEEEDEPSYAVRRVTFDNYLLQQVKQKDVTVFESRITGLEFGPGRVMVYSESNNLPADAVVGAFGSDGGTARLFEESTPYRPPRFLYTLVTKVHPGEEFMAKFGGHIHAFLPSLKNIEFGAIVPKGNHLTIITAGAKITSEWTDRFLNLKVVRDVLPPDFERYKPTLAYYKGCFPVSVARNFYGERYCIIGDAAGLVRPFKGKGVNSAALSGILAAQTMFKEGISKDAFETYYEGCREITSDLIFGRLIRRATIFSANTGLLDIVIEKAKHDYSLRRFLYDCVSARKSFRSIFREIWGHFPFLFRLPRPPEADSQ